MSSLYPCPGPKHQPYKIGPSLGQPDLLRGCCRKCRAEAGGLERRLGEKRALADPARCGARSARHKLDGEVSRGQPLPGG
jgi:hypothetical protein